MHLVCFLVHKLKHGSPRGGCTHHPSCLLGTWPGGCQSYSCQEVFVGLLRNQRFLIGNGYVLNWMFFSAAYTTTPMYRTPTWHPIAGLATEPCFVPFVIEKLVDTACPHLTQAYCCSYITVKIPTTIGGKPVSSSLLNIVPNLQVSKALEQSNTVRIGFESFLKYQFRSKLEPAIAL